MEKQTIQPKNDRMEEKEIFPLDITGKEKNDPDLAKKQRENGLLLTGRRGFDIISNRFFVEERLLNGAQSSADYYQEEKKHFDSFDEYYEYLNGSVYDESC